MENEEQNNLRSQNILHVSFITKDSIIQNQSLQPQENQISSEQKQKKVNSRFDSLDVHHGLTMFGMVIVDCGEQHMPWYLQIPDWSGFSPADLIFPSFIFLWGMAIPLATYICIS